MKSYNYENYKSKDHFESKIYNTGNTTVMITKYNNDIITQ